MDSRAQAEPLEVRSLRVADDWDLQDVEAEWNAFISSRFPTYFYRDYAWSRAWWQAYAQGDQVHIYLLRQPGSGSLVGILAFWIKRESFGGFPVRLLEILVRGLGSEDLLIDPGYVDAAREPLAEILDSVRWDVARFSNLRNKPTSKLLTTVGEHLRLGVETSIVPRSFIRTSGSFEDYLKARSGSFRKKNRVALRRAAAVGEISFRQHDLWTIPQGELAAAEEIARKSWQYRQAGSHFCQLRSRSLIDGLVDSPVQPTGEATMSLMKLGDQDVAFNFCAQSEGRLEGIEQAFVKDFASCSPGRLLLLQVIEQKFQDPRTDLFVLGTGEGYLGRFTDETDALQNLVFFRNSLYGNLISVARRSRFYQALRDR